MGSSLNSYPSLNSLWVLMSPAWRTRLSRHASCRSRAACCMTFAWRSAKARCFCLLAWRSVIASTSSPGSTTTRFSVGFCPSRRSARELSIGSPSSRAPIPSGLDSCAFLTTPANPSFLAARLNSLRPSTTHNLERVLGAPVGGCSFLDQASSRVMIPAQPRSACPGWPASAASDPIRAGRHR